MPTHPDMTELSFPSLTLLALGLTYLLVARYIRSVLSWKARSRGRPLPPGPTPLPIVGNIFSAPKTKAWEAYRDMSQTYGEYLPLFIRIPRR